MIVLLRPENASWTSYVNAGALEMSSSFNGNGHTAAATSRNKMAVSCVISICIVRSTCPRT